jgi:hypothetical protein
MVSLCGLLLPARLPPRYRRRCPQQPGITNACSVSLPDTNALSTSSTGPQVCGMTSTPADNSMASSGREIAPQISTSAPDSATRRARGPSSGSSTICSVRQTSRPFSISTSSRRLAASKTGEILPSEIGIAVLMIDKGLQELCPVGISNYLET